MVKRASTRAEALAHRVPGHGRQCAILASRLALQKFTQLGINRGLSDVRVSTCSDIAFPSVALQRTQSVWNGTGSRTFLRMLDKRLPLYGVTVRPCTIHAGRFRWDILENGRPVQSSPESFATKQEAVASGFAEIEKLISARGYKK